MRIGYFGGTFDPPHRAHLRVAQAAADAFLLDRVLLAPTGLQPLKTGAATAGFADRMAMVRLLCAEDSRLEAASLDRPREDGEPNYTVSALAELRAELPDVSLFSIAGIDSFLTLPRWREPHRLIELAEWIVVARPEVTPQDFATLGLGEQELRRVHFLPDVAEDVSATEVRERLRVGVSCGDMLTPTVALYIARMHLYHAE